MESEINTQKNNNQVKKDLLYNGKKENLYQEVLDLENNSRLVKTAHFLAAQRKQQTYRILGTSIIIINIVIFSPILDLTIPNYSAVSIKFLAIISASLAGIQTLFNFQKDTESHLSAGSIYANIYHRAGLLLAKYRDNLDTDKFLINFEILQQEYLKTNSDYKSCIPSNKEYEKAKKSMNERDKK